MTQVEERRIGNEVVCPRWNLGRNNSVATAAIPVVTASLKREGEEESETTTSTVFYRDRQSGRSHSAETV